MPPLSEHELQQIYNRLTTKLQQIYNTFTTNLQIYNKFTTNLQTKIVAVEGTLGSW